MNARQPVGREPVPRVAIHVNGAPYEIDTATTIADLLQQLRLESQLVAVEVNRQLVPRQRHAQTRLAAGDHLEIVTLVGGG